MKKYLLTIAEVKKFVGEHPEVATSLTELIRHAISVKQTGFSKETFKTQHEIISLYGLSKNESDKIFQVDFDTLETCYVLAEIAEEITASKIPSEPLEALKFAAAFGLQIKQPNPRHWWAGDMERQLQSYLMIYLHQVHGVDITSFVFGITEKMKEDMPETRSVDTNYRNVFAYLSDATEIAFSTLTKLLANDRTKHTAFESLQDVGIKNPIKAVALYEYSKLQHAENQDGYMPNIIRGLFSYDERHYLQEAIDLFALSSLQSLHTLTWLDYTKSEQVETSYQFLTTQNVEEIEYLRALPTFYIRLIENPLTPTQIVKDCFEHLKTFTKHEDVQLRDNLVSRTGMIDGHDREKYELFSNFMSWGNPRIIGHYFDRFDSPIYLFDLVKQAFLAHGMTVDMNLFRDALHTQYMMHRDLFGQQLLKLLSHDIAILRFAGIQVMTSAYNQAYEVDFLQLDEAQQLRVIETVLPSPLNIEELLPLIMPLKNSPFPDVKIKLTKELCELVHAYDKSLVEMTGQYLDESVDTDKALIDAIAAAYTVYKKEKEARIQTKELNPVENELEYLEMYFRLEQEQQAEMMEKAQGQSPFAMITKNMNIIRGSGYCSERNPGITTMEGIGVSRLIDQRYSINPDKYEWEYKMNATVKNYNTTTK